MAERRARLDQPKTPGRALRPRYDADAFGRLTERIARFLGTGRYLVFQSTLVLLWIAWNLIFQKKPAQFDHYPYILLTLALSLQAAYSAPLILLAQNRQDDRDRVNLDQDRDQDRQSKADLEYLARELAAVRIALGDVVTRDFLRGELQRTEQRESREKAKAKPKPSDPKPSDPKPSDPKPSDSKLSDNKLSDNKTGDTRPTAAKAEAEPTAP